MVPIKPKVVFECPKCGMKLVDGDAKVGMCGECASCGHKYCIATEKDGSLCIVNVE